MLILRLLLYYQCAKEAVLDEAFNYAPHNEAPVLSQTIPEEVEESLEENASSESQGVVSENVAAVTTGTGEELGSPNKTRKAYSV